MFKERKIWLEGANNPDTYVDFYGKFNYCFDGKVKLNIVCDGAFTFYLNGQKEFFGSCADFPNDKEFYTFDITDYCKAKNDFKITVWHIGNDSFTYIKDDAFLAFNVTCGGKLLTFSGEHILASINPNYVSGLKKNITMMLGYSFAFDNTVNFPFSLSNVKEYGYVIDTHTAVAKAVHDEYIEKTGDITKTVIASTASPFKFSQSVLIALEGCGYVAGKDEFALLDDLSAISEMNIPKSLAELKNKNRIFDVVCEKEQMPQVVNEMLNI